MNRKCQGTKKGLKERKRKGNRITEGKDDFCKQLNSKIILSGTVVSQCILHWAFWFPHFHPTQRYGNELAFLSLTVFLGRIWSPNRIMLCVSQPQEHCTRNLVREECSLNAKKKDDNATLKECSFSVSPAQSAHLQSTRGHQTNANWNTVCKTADLYSF